MRKAKFVRIDDLKTEVDLRKLKGFKPVAKNHLFSPILVTPNINIELNSFTETFQQLINLPNNSDFANEFFEETKDLYIANGYEEDVIINNMIVQLLLMSGYIELYDLTRSCITEKVNRETLAAAKFATTKRFDEIVQLKKADKKNKNTKPSKKNDKGSEK